MERRAEKMKWVKTFCWMIVFLFAIHFSMQNKDDVTLRYSIQNYQLFEILKIPLFIVIFCSLFLGVLIGGMSDFYRRYQLKKTLRQNQKTIERLEREIHSLYEPSGEQPSSLRKEA